MLFSGQFHNFYTDEILDEIIAVLRRKKFNLEREKRDHFVHILSESSFLVEPLAEFTVAKCRDAKDDKFLSLANQAEADYLISLDDDLLDLKKIGGAIITDPGAFLKRAVK
jgi:putative PIN family toxin of toxin-antitoxin system